MAIADREKWAVSESQVHVDQPIDQVVDVGDIRVLSRVSAEIVVMVRTARVLGRAAKVLGGLIRALRR